MENLSRPVRSVKIPLTVAIPDYLRDHRYDGRIILPAAEALQILARSLPDDLPGCDIRLQERGEFTHLLHLDPDADAFNAFHEIDFFPDGRRLSRLTTLRSGRQKQWTRSIEHVSVSFLPFEGKEDGNAIPASEPWKAGDDPTHHTTQACNETFENRDPSARWTFFDPAPPRSAQRKMRDSSLFSPENRELSPFSKGATLWGQGAPKNLQCALPGSEFQRSCTEAVEKEEPSFRFSSRRLYADLVPFGPAYHNVVGEIALTVAGATASVSGGDFREAVGPLGSPFPLDAAMHVACAWGQRYRDCVAFPVGFDRREIILPTSAGETYRCLVFPLQDDGAVLRFDIGLFGKDDRPAEMILGLRMRDISGGRLKPPAWVREGI